MTTTQASGIGATPNSSAVHVAASGQAQAAIRHQAPAVIVGFRPAVTGGLRAGPPHVLLTVRWAVPGGRPRTGQLIMASNEVAGITTIGWLTRDGQLSAPPPSLAQDSSRATFTAAGVAVLLALLLAIVSRVVSLTLDRHRLARWGADWSVTGPQWTGRR